MSLPRQSNFTTGARDAMFAVQNTSPETYFATTGRAFIEQVQTILRGMTFGSRKAYRVDGPLGGGYVLGPSNTDFGEVIVDGRWGPVTNAALWRAVAERSGASIGLIGEASDFDTRTLEYLDAIERAAQEQSLNTKAVEAAAWLWMSGTLPWSQSGSIVVPANAVLPVWNQQPPLPNNPTMARGGPGEWVRWQDGQPEPSYMPQTNYTPPNTDSLPANRPPNNTQPPSSGFPWVPVGITVTLITAVGLGIARKYGRI